MGRDQDCSSFPDKLGFENEDIYERTDQGFLEPKFETIDSEKEFKERLVEHIESKGIRCTEEVNVSGPNENIGPIADITIESHSIAIECKADNSRKSLMRAIGQCKAYSYMDYIPMIAAPLEIKHIVADDGEDFHRNTRMKDDIVDHAGITYTRFNLKTEKMVPVCINSRVIEDQLL